MTALDLKLLRDIGKMKGQMVAVSLVMACGLAMMIMSRSLILSLESTRDAYYERNRFADVFCDLKRAPNALRARLAEIPGVAAVETRVTGARELDLPGLPEPADGTVLSLPDDRPQQLNLLLPAPRTAAGDRAAAAKSSSARRSPRRTASSRAMRSTPRSTARGSA